MSSQWATCFQHTIDWSPSRPQEYLVYRQFTTGEFEAVINFQELQPCIVAMANMLPAFQRRVCPQDEEALENPEEFDKIERVVRALLSVIQRQNGSSISGSMPEVLMNLRQVTMSEDFGPTAVSRGFEAEVSLRFLYHLSYFVDSRFILIRGNMFPAQYGAAPGGPNTGGIWRPD